MLKDKRQLYYIFATALLGISFSVLAADFFTLSDFSPLKPAWKNCFTGVTQSSCRELEMLRDWVWSYTLIVGFLLTGAFCSFLFYLGIFRVNIRLERERRDAESASRAKSYFVARISHEIRTPLNAILGFSEMLSASELNAIQRNYLATIVSSGKLLLGIINDILDFSKLESGKMKIESIDFDLEQTIYDLFKTVQTRFKEYNLNVYIDWDQGLPRWVKGDPTRLRQVLLNLLGNASKFTLQGEIGLKVAMIKQDADEGCSVKFNVKDTGIGVPYDKQKTIFSAFIQSEESIPRKLGGTGIGLAISKRIIEAMGGEIGFVSRPGVGSDFFFTLQFKPGLSLVTQPIQPLRLQMLHGRKVLLVDDHLPSLEIIGRFCHELGLNVVASVRSGQAALNMVNKLYQDGLIPELILSDVVMPGMDGYELARRIRLVHAYQQVKIIAITSDVRVGAAQAAQEKGFDGFLPKPINRHDLAGIIATVLGDKRQGDAPIITRHVAEEVGLKGLKVLVVDDSTQNQQVIKDCLDSFGCVVSFANNGQEAVEKIQDGSYDLCLMDLQMPVMSGEEAVRRLRTGGSKLPVLGIAAATSVDDLQRCVEAGMDDVVSKPLQSKVLKDKMDEVLRKARE